MGKGKKPKEEDAIPADQRRVVVRPRTWQALVKMGAEQERDPTELANQAIREFVERHGYWSAIATNHSDANQ